MLSKNSFEDQVKNVQHPDPETREQLQEVWQEIYQDLELSQTIAKEIFGREATPAIVFSIYDRATAKIDDLFYGDDDEDYDDEDYDDENDED